MTKLPYRELKIWQKAMCLTTEIYTVTQSFPQTEKFGLISQLRRASVSIPSSIAEGSQRTSDKDFFNYICIAKGSLAELETQIILSHEFSYIDNSVLNSIHAKVQELQRMLHSFGQSLTKR